MRLRTLYGTFALIFGLALYALLVMRLAIAILPDIWLAQIPYYAVAGVAWIWPAAKLTKWMQDLPAPPSPYD
jgi:hypothetical protein